MFEIAERQQNEMVNGLLDWQQELKNNITTIDQLKAYLPLEQAEEDALRKVVGKLEICGQFDDKLILKHLHARPGCEEESSSILIRQLTDDGGWLDDLPEITF